MAWGSSRLAVVQLLALVCGICRVDQAVGQLSDPVAEENLLQESSNKFLQRKGSLELDDEEYDWQYCRKDLDIRWATEIAASVYAPPLITDLYSDGHKDIVVPAFVHYLEALQGRDGQRLAGWPAVHKSSVHSSPLLYDFDSDGVLDIALPTYNGVVYFFKDNGKAFDETITVPRLRVRRDWFRGLRADAVDHSHPDVSDQGFQDEYDYYHGRNMAPLPPDEQREPPFVDASGDADPGAGTNHLGSEELAGLRRRRSLLSAYSSEGLQDTPGVEHDPEGDITEEGAKSFGVFEEEQYSGEDNEVAGMGGLGEHQYYSDDNDYGNHIFDDGYHAYDDYGRSTQEGTEYIDYYASHELDDHLWEEDEHEREDMHVWVDSHIVASPVIADLDHDGAEELVVPVSYFYDSEYYDNPEHAKQVEGLDIRKYVASGIVVFDLVTRQVKWSQHLDLTTDYITHRAYVYSSPTVMDLNGDGLLEVIVGTSVGFVYVLGHDGEPEEGWPIQMGDIQGQVVVADVNDDGELEVVAGDIRGNFAVFDRFGKEIWERHLGAMIAAPATVADVDGDGHTDLVIGCASGKVFAMKGNDGSDLKGFPFKTFGRVLSQISVTKFYPDSAEMQLLVTSFDGSLYVIDGDDGCSDSVDLGETSYSPVLIEDMDDNGKLDFIVATMNGNIFCIESSVEAHPLKTWPSAVLGRNGFAARYGRRGIYATPASRAMHDVGGEIVQVQFEIVDNLVSRNKSMDDLRAKYIVRIAMQTEGPSAVAVRAEYSKTGTYTLALPCPRERGVALMTLELTDEHGGTYTDFFALSFNQRFHRIIKWILVLPFTAAAAFVLAQRRLPGFSLDFPPM